MSKFAGNTSVSVEKSRAEIESIVRRYGADSFVSGWEDDRAMVRFRCAGRYVRFVMTLPARNERSFTHSQRGMRSAPLIQKAWEQGCRQIWRALALLVKAKLEAVESKIVTFEEEFLAHITLPDGRSVYEHARKSVALAYEGGEMPKMIQHFNARVASDTES